MSANPRNISLEPAAQAFVEATSQPPFLYQLPPEEGRKAVDGVQDEPIAKPEVDERWIDLTLGMTVVDFRAPAADDCHTSVAVDLDHAGFWNLVIDALERIGDVELPQPASR